MIEDVIVDISLVLNLYCINILHQCIDTIAAIISWLVRCGLRLGSRISWIWGISIFSGIGAGLRDEDGKEFLVTGLVPMAEFHDRYQEASGLEIDPVKLHFYEVLSRFQQVQTLLGTAYRVARLGKSHQNVVVARLEGPSYLLAEELRRALEDSV